MDAAANRAREALRCLEDTARFILSDRETSAGLKAIRHDLIAALKPLGLSSAAACRDIGGDVGKNIKQPAQRQLQTAPAVAEAAFGRASEALRSLEEIAKTLDISAADAIESLRYKLYEVAQVVQVAMRQLGRLPSAILCVLITESLCRRDWVQTLDAVLAGGADMVQLREKRLDDRELLQRARWLSDRCCKASCVPIINDRFDIALACGAGVHVGHTDLPCAELRKLAPEEMIIGVSTSRIEEARQAVRDGASYIGIGPMFSSPTKVKSQLAGISYARQVADESIPIPSLAISGITLDNIQQVLAAGARAVAVSSSVIGAEDPAAVCRSFKQALASHVLAADGDAGAI